MKISWTWAAVGAAALYVLYRLNRAQGADLPNLVKQPPVLREPPLGNDVLTRAEQLAHVVRKDPGVAAIMGLDADSINRIIYQPDAYANISGQAKSPGQVNFFDWHSNPYVAS